MDCTEKDGFGDVLRKQFFPDEKAVVKRVTARTCWYATQQMNLKFTQLRQEIELNQYQFGVLLVAADTPDNVIKAKETSQALVNDEDTTGRIIICVLEYTLDSKTIDAWYNATAQSQLATKSNNQANADSYKTEASDLIGSWVSTAIGKSISLIFKGGISKQFSNKGAISAMEKRVFDLFNAAPETIVKKNTLYKTSSTVVTFYGAARVTNDNKASFGDKAKNFNTQWQDVVDILKEHSIWDADLPTLKSLEESKVQRSMAALAVLVDKELGAGTVFLSDLWDKIQSELGYYNTTVCGYLLGFVFRFYEGQYTWNDGSNPHKLDTDNIPTMVHAMLNGKSAGMKLASESETEKRFEDIVRRIFGLKPEETADISETRKNLKIWLTKNGYPMWNLKYADDNHFAGQKEDIISITDKLVEYILEKGGQTEVIEDITALVKKNPKAYINILKTALADKNVMADALRNFIFLYAPETKQVCADYGFSTNILRTSLSRMLEEEVWQWQENEVAEKTKSLALDLKLIGIVNHSLGHGTATTVEKIKENLANKLQYSKIPGVVLTASEAGWAKALRYLHAISTNHWVGLNTDDKEMVLSSLAADADEAIEVFNNPVHVLRDFIVDHGMGNLSDADYNAILEQLVSESYQQTEQTFRQAVRRRIDALEYTKKVAQIKNLWVQKSGSGSIAKWTLAYQMPVVWVAPEYTSLLDTLSAIEKGEHKDMNLLDKALEDIKAADFSVLQDKSLIDNAFIMHVSSEKMKTLLSPHIMAIKQKIQNAGYKNPTSWNSAIVVIRSIVDEFVKKDLQGEVSDKAKKKAESMSEAELRAVMSKLLESSAEACLLLLNQQK